uniref:Uncharacterized protein n=1 Tax=Meloidogyne enterolobii TaxID=390850 RepID=A0A6V7U716_MELEN|nr:unnamed protein product [Meloidogyne enterolobii]
MVKIIQIFIFFIGFILFFHKEVLSFEGELDLTQRSRRSPKPILDQLDWYNLKNNENKNETK